MLSMYSHPGGYGVLTSTHSTWQPKEGFPSMQQVG